MVEGVPSVGVTVSISRGIIHKAEIMDEEWIADKNIGDPARYITALAKSPVRADFFSLSQKLPETTPKYCYPFEWDNVAAICTAAYDDWWNGLPQEARKNCRRASRRGVVVRPFLLTDDMIQQVINIYNETPVRQGRPFAHYGKCFETVKREISSLVETSEFIGAFYGAELIGYIKIVHMGDIAGILHIVSKNKHYDKRPSNALVAAAAEHCRDKKISFLTYGKYTYGNKADSPLTEFKRRMGFVKIQIPRYYVPLTLAGRMFTSLKLHRGLIGLLPSWIFKPLLGMRSWLVHNFWVPLRSLPKS